MSSPELDPHYLNAGVVPPSQRIFDHGPEFNTGIVHRQVPYAEAEAFVKDRHALHVTLGAGLTGTETPLPSPSHPRVTTGEIYAQFTPDPDPQAPEAAPGLTDAENMIVHGITVVLHKKGIRRRPAELASVFIDTLVSYRSPLVAGETSAADPDEQTA
jgi:hypothetical protein